MRKIIVIGGGAAGMMAAVAAAKQGASVTLLEKNEKTGKKIFVQGYWKGPLREYKYTDEPREREIVRPDDVIVDNIH